MWRTTFALQNWHSAVELKRYFLRFIQELPRIHTLAGVRRTRLNQYDSIVLPIQRWLADRSVVVEHGVRVVDDDFSSDGVRRLEKLHVERDGRTATVELTEHDFAFLTIASMTSDAGYGDDLHAPELIRDKRDAPECCGTTSPARPPTWGTRRCSTATATPPSGWGFTATIFSPLLIHRIQEFSGNAPGTGALMTFTDSRWLMSIVVPQPPHFAYQSENVYTLWATGCSPTNPAITCPPP